MKNHKLLTALFVLIMGSVLFVSSCKDDETDLGLIGSWKVATATFNPAIDTNGTAAGGIVTNAYPLLFAQTCDQDDLFIFEDAGVFKEDEGATKCNSTDPQYTQGTYTQSGSTVTIINSNNDTTVFSNVSINNETFTGRVHFNFGLPSGADVDFVLDRQ